MVGSRSLGAILSLLRWTMLLHEGSACIPVEFFNDFTSQSQCLCNMQPVELRGCCFTKTAEWHHLRWCDRCSPGEPMANNRTSTNWSHDAEERQFCEWVPDVTPCVAPWNFKMIFKLSSINSAVAWIAVSELTLLGLASQQSACDRRPQRSWPQMEVPCQCIQLHQPAIQVGLPKDMLPVDSLPSWACSSARTFASRHSFILRFTWRWCICSSHSLADPAHCTLLFPPVCHEWEHLCSALDKCNNRMWPDKRGFKCLTVGKCAWVRHCGSDHRPSSRISFLNIKGFCPLSPSKSLTSSKCWVFSHTGQKRLHNVKMQRQIEGPRFTTRTGSLSMQLASSPNPSHNPVRTIVFDFGIKQPAPPISCFENSKHWRHAFAIKKKSVFHPANSIVVSPACPSSLKKFLVIMTNELTSAAAASSFVSVEFLFFNLVIATTSHCPMVGTALTLITPHHCNQQIFILFFWEA